MIIGAQVVLQASTNGGQSWTTLTTFYYGSYKTTPYFVSQVLPSTAVNTPVAFRWYQQSASGNNRQVVLIDNIYIGSPINVTQQPYLQTFESALNA